MSERANAVCACVGCVPVRCLLLLDRHQLRFKPANFFFPNRIPKLKPMNIRVSSKDIQNQPAEAAFRAESISINEDLQIHNNNLKRQQKKPKMLLNE